MIAIPAIEDFHPPYHLGAFGCVLVGVWEGRRVGSTDRGGFEPVRWRGGHVGAAFVLRYDRPPADHPVAYNEVILADVVRRSARWAAMPFDLVLDDAFYVDAGRLYYHLPKRLDPTLRIELERDATGAPTRMTAAGVDVVFDVALGSTAVPCVEGLGSALLRGLTSHTTVIGAASLPLLGATIAVDPETATARSVRKVRLAAGGRTLRPLGARFWGSMAITVGVPHPVAR